AALRRLRVWESVPSARIAGGGRRRRRHPEVRAGSRLTQSVAEVNRAVAETAFVEELELQTDIVRKGLLAASHHDGRDEQLELVDQAGLDRLGREVGTSDADVTLCRRLKLPNRLRVEGSLDPRPGA